METTSLVDSELITRFQQGEDHCFTALMQKYKAKVFTQIVLVIKDREIASDILQDTFLKAIETLRTKKYNEQGKFLPWILRIAHNLSIDYIRKQQKMPKADIDPHSYAWDALLSSEGNEKNIVQNDTKNLLRTLIHQLPFEQREVLLMRHFANMSFKEISETTGVSINTILGRMRYALRNLKKNLEHVNYAYDQEFYRR